MNGANTDVLLAVESVRWKECKTGTNIGTLQILKDSLVWKTVEQRVAHHLSKIKGQRVSPDGKTKVMLQVNLHDGTNMSFIFLAPAGLKKQTEEKNTAKEMLQQLLPTFRNHNSAAATNGAPSTSNNVSGSGDSGKKQSPEARARSKAAEESTRKKQKLLKEDAGLFRLYTDLVTTSIITPEEFWAEVAGGKLEEAEKETQQSVGVAGGFLLDVSKHDGCNGIKLNLTPDIILSIFKTYPAVKAKHSSAVPHEKTEKEFWAEFFKSHYFHRDRTLNQSPAEFFADCLKLDETDMTTAAERTAAQATTLDLSRLEEKGFLAEEEEEELKRRGSDPAHIALMRRFNYHSTRVLQASLTQTAAAAAASSSKAPDQGPPKPVIESVELASEQLSAPAKLSLRSTDAYTGYPSSSSAGKDAEEPINSESLPKYRRNLAAALASMSVEPGHSLWSDDSEAASLGMLEDSSPGGELWTKEWLDLNAGLPKETLERIRQAYEGLNELLRHFWSAFPPNTPALIAKVERFGGTLSKFTETRLVPLEKELKESQPQALAVMDHLKKMRDLALEKLRAWQARRGSAAKKPKTN